MSRKFRDSYPMQLVVAGAGEHRATRGRLELRVSEAGHPLAGGKGVCADFSTLDISSAAGRSLRSPLLAAVGIRRGESYRPWVLDGTAGLGEDSWLLAAAGCRVTAVERHPVIHALLDDALSHAAHENPEVAGRITLLPCAATAEVLAKWEGDQPDVVLLDPMFPGKRKTAERKPMRVLRWLVGDDIDADDLLEPAWAVAGRRVVVKRPRKAPVLAGKTPVTSREGKGFRFDVYSTTLGQTGSAI